MNALLTPFRQLVDRKLWPLAILLVAALAAVPVLLAKKDDNSTVMPIASAGAGSAQSPTQPIVTLGDAAEREAARKVLGSRKNPFEPAVKAKKAKDSSATTTTTTSGGDGAKAGGGSGSGGSGSSDNTACVVTSDTLVCKKDGFGPTGGAEPGSTGATQKKRSYELYQLKIRFGSTSSADLANRSVKRLTALPKMAEPTLIYLGLKADQKTAVFLVDANTLVVGDGKCVPSPSDCQNLELKKGQTAFIDVLGEGGESVEQYQLDYVKVLKKTTSVPRAARSARLSVAKGGRDALRSRISRVNGWDYDPETGVLARR